MTARTVPNAGHKIDKLTHSYVLYSVWDNRTDELVILDGTAKQCAEIMGRPLKSFYSTVRRAKTGEIKRWTILSRIWDEESEVDGE